MNFQIKEKGFFNNMAPESKLSLGINILIIVIFLLNSLSESPLLVNLLLLPPGFFMVVALFVNLIFLDGMNLSIEGHIF